MHTADTSPARRARTSRGGLDLAASVSWRLLVVGATVVVLALVLARLRLVVLPLAVAVLLATILIPPTAKLRRRGVPAALAASTILTAGLAVLGGAVALIVVPVWDELDRLDVSVRGGVERIGDWLAAGPLHLSEQQVDDAIARSFEQLRQHGDAIAGGFVSGGLVALELLAGAVLALVFLFFLLKDGDAIWNNAVRLFPRARRPEVREVGRRVWGALGAYLRGVSAVALVDAVLIGTALQLIGVPLALPLAVLTFLGGYVPIVGATVAGFAATMVALVSEGFISALLVAGVVLAVQQLEGHLLQPVIVGRQVRLHPLAIIVAVSSGGILWGIPGAFVAVPLTVVVTTLARHRRATAAPQASAVDRRPRAHRAP